MTKMKRVKRRSRIIYITLVITFLLITVFAYKFYHDIFYLENHCQQVAMQEVGGYKGWGSKLVESSYWFGHGEKIYIGFAKQLECEHNDKAFYFF